MRKKITKKGIQAFIKTDKEDSVRVIFTGDSFTPTQFTSLFMGILDTYTQTLMTNNSKEAVFTHWNDVFGIFLNKIIPEVDKKADLSKHHKEYVDNVNSILIPDEKLTDDERLKLALDTDTNKMAAMILVREILTEEMGMSPQSADLIINKRMQGTTLKTPGSTVS